MLDSELVEALLLSYGGSTEADVLPALGTLDAAAAKWGAALPEEIARRDAKIKKLGESLAAAKRAAQQLALNDPDEMWDRHRREFTAELTKAQIESASLLVHPLAPRLKKVLTQAGSEAERTRELSRELCEYLLALCDWVW